MSRIPGRWALRMRTPVGSIEAEMTFTERDGGLTGEANGKGETVALHDVTTHPHPDGERVTWRQSITRPLRLDLLFDVVVAGDELQGHSRAGRLPKSTVTGHRLAD
ncbi:hypothetical protein [Modestobacter roseus]|uniref:Uncharacterized protein n=1 Tax=Modestobacter roseus TaxID=1181884 RepID=A0A562IPD1_9ACTN|nr:hypothetical protein [Modestobacter roseus]MQA35343.1 hypothetical protein [Modestobacter roseus]TWH72563.1 hypothetical protein JD78_01079 [Modestobacter roseus]